MLRNKKGQSTIEYIILVTGVISVLIIFLGSPTSPFRTHLNQTLETVTEGMEGMATELAESHGNTLP